MKEIIRLDEQRRIYVSNRGLAACGFKFPKDESIRVWAFIAGSGQLQLLPTDNKLSKLRDELDPEALRSVDWDASGDDEVKLYQQLQSFLQVTCHPRKNRTKTSLTLPAEAIKIGLFAARSTVVVVTTGRIFQIWSTDRWQQSSRISDLRAFVEDVEQISQ